MRTGEKHDTYTPTQIQEVLEAKLNPETQYYHDMGKGIVYAHKNHVTGEYEHPLVDIFRLTGRYDIMTAPINGKPMVEFNITTGCSRDTIEWMYRDNPVKLEKLITELYGKKDGE